MTERVTKSGRLLAKREALAYIDEHQTAYHRVADAIWSYAELPMQETLSSALLTARLEASGFAVERGVAGIPTAFVATASNGTGKPVIGILAEYDALPALSQTPGHLSRLPLVVGAPGHGCTHNVMGATSICAATALRQILSDKRLSGTIKVFGCPGEEASISRPYMVRAGLFDGLDAVLDNHGTEEFRPLAGVSASGLISLTVTFHGQSAHAAGDPWHGTSALHAVELMSHAVNVLREHLHYSNRVHYVVTDGGGSPNVVPESASVWCYVRGSDDRLMQDYRRVLLCAEGAAIATGCTHHVRVYSGTHQNYNNRALADVMARNVAEIGMPEWSQDDIRFARLFQKANGLRPRGMAARPGSVHTQKKSEFTGGGSSDVGEVTLVAPTTTLFFPALPRDIRGHHWHTVSLAATPIAHRGITAAAKVLAATGVDLLCDAGGLGDIKAEFSRLRKRVPYQTYLPDDAVPPIELNRDAMNAVRSMMAPFHFDVDSEGGLVDVYSWDDAARDSDTM